MKLIEMLVQHKVILNLCRRGLEESIKSLFVGFTELCTVLEELSGRGEVISVGVGGNSEFWSQSGTGGVSSSLASLSLGARCGL
jgi:hypothetical protein